MTEGKARIKNEKAECLKDAANACPREAVLLDDVRGLRIKERVLIKGEKREFYNIFGGRENVG